jgi:uracil-DNA glycosylase
MPTSKTAEPRIPAGIEPRRVQIVMVCEALPESEEDYFYASSPDSLYVTNTLEAFNSAGIKVKNIDDVVKKGVYLTVAVKEPRKGAVVPGDVIEEHSYSLEEELRMFPNTKAILLMGDAAIKALNFISRRLTKTRAIPAGSTYKIRGETLYFGDIRVFPSYLPTGKNFLIEKSKRRMVAEDIRNAFELLQQ